MTESAGTTGAAADLEGTLNLQRKAAIAGGGPSDHAGRVRVKRLVDFDIKRTIFSALGGFPKVFMEEKLAKEAVWNDESAAEVEKSYAKGEETSPSPKIDRRLVDFLVSECDFRTEHADGSFLDHLVFCHDYAARHYPDHSPNVALLHSVLGTATNYFPMEAEKMPKLMELLTDFEALHVQVFPSILRLFYAGDFLAELEENAHRIDKIESLELHRVIDNELLTVDAKNMWINLNYHLMHFVDFMPPANWYTNSADPLLQMFERLSNLLDKVGKREAHVYVAFPSEKTEPIDEERTYFGRIAGLILPAPVSLMMAKKSIKKYSKKINHDLSYRLNWAS